MVTSGMVLMVTTTITTTTDPRKRDSSHPPLTIINTSPSPGTDVITPEGIRILGRHARLIDRIWAWIIDAVATASVVGGVRLLLTVCGVDTTIVQALSLLIVPVYMTFALWITNGQSLGKYIGRVRVRRISGHRMDIQTAAMRFIGSVVLIGLDWVWCLWDRNGRALHDHLAGTVVIVDETVESRDQPLSPFASLKGTTRSPTKSVTDTTNTIDDEEFITLPTLSSSSSSSSSRE
jgi:uncharacterized RDD family membrane protein YckC